MNYPLDGTSVRDRRQRCLAAKESYMFSVLSMSHARFHWPLAFLWRATLSLSICSRSFFHRTYSTCSSFDVGMLRSVLACSLSGSLADTKQLHWECVIHVSSHPHVQHRCS